MSSKSRSKSNANSDRPLATIVTYRYNGKLVYVPPPTTWSKAVTNALAEFPELKAWVPERISFWVTATVNGKKDKVRISSKAWDEMLRRLVQHEIIDIIILETPPPSPLPVIIDIEAPPQYDADDKARNAFLAVDTHSRRNSSSPAGSRSGSRSSSPNIASRAMNWIKNEINH